MKIHIVKQSMVDLSYRLNLLIINFVKLTHVGKGLTITFLCYLIYLLTFANYAKSQA